MLCEAVCGIKVEVDGPRVLSVRGDPDDPFSRGHVCPKVAAIDDVRNDPDRILAPLRREGDRHVEVSWDAALDEAAERIARIQDEHGRHSVAVYLGNPVAHTYSGQLYATVFSKALHTHSKFSATSVDQLPQMIAAWALFGHQMLIPIPDVDRTDFFLILGANPAVSNGSIMTAPGIADRIKKIRARGGRVVVIDPRRTETAELAGEHHFIRPGTDALLLFAMIHVVFEERLAALGRFAAFTDGVDALERAARDFPPEAVAEVTGIGAGAIRELARAFARTPRAACYGRVGTSTQEFGSLASWLVVALNLVTGHLDEVGGAMFTTPAVDAVDAMARVGQKGHYARWKSRVRGLPEFGGELPVAALAEEIEAPGDGQIRALITFAGNPVLSTPNGGRLERALAKLDFMLSIDIYKNETTRHAHLILPTSFGFERDHYDVALNTFGVRNAARYATAIFEPAGKTRHDWQILGELTSRLDRKRKSARPSFIPRGSDVMLRLGPRRIMDVMLRLGPHRLSLRKLEKKSPHGIDLGALRPAQLPGRLFTKERRLDVAPALYLDQVPLLVARLARPRTSERLELIGRRQLRSNNSWMHNSLRLVKGRERCTLLMHPADAAARGIAHGEDASVTSSVGAVVAKVEISDEMAPGVVSLPHGWGHTRPGTDLKIASAHPGVSLNDLTEELTVDGISGNAGFSGVRVAVEGIRP